MRQWEIPLVLNGAMVSFSGPYHVAAGHECERVNWTTQSGKCTRFICVNLLGFRKQWFSMRPMVPGFAGSARGRGIGTRRGELDAKTSELQPTGDNWLRNYDQLLGGQRLRSGLRDRNEMILRRKRRPGGAHTIFGNRILNLIMQLSAFLFAIDKSGGVEANLAQLQVTASAPRVSTLRDDVLLTPYRYAHTYFTERYHTFFVQYRSPEA